MMISLKQKHLRFLKYFNSFSSISKEHSDLKRDKLRIRGDGRDIVFSLFHNSFGGMVKILEGANVGGETFSVSYPIDVVDGIVKTLKPDDYITFSEKKIEFRKSTYEVEAYNITMADERIYVSALSKLEPKKIVGIRDRALLLAVSSFKGEGEYATVAVRDSFYQATDRYTKFAFACTDIDENIFLDSNLISYIGAEEVPIIYYYEDRFLAFWHMQITEIYPKEKEKGKEVMNTEADIYGRNISLFCTNSAPEIPDLMRENARVGWDHKNYVSVSYTDFVEVIDRLSVVTSKSQSKSLRLKFEEQGLVVENTDHNRSKELISYIDSSHGSFPPVPISVTVSSSLLKNALSSIEIKVSRKKASRPKKQSTEDLPDPEVVEEEKPEILTLFYADDMSVLTLEMGKIKAGVVGDL